MKTGTATVCYHLSNGDRRLEHPARASKSKVFVPRADGTDDVFDRMTGEGRAGRTLMQFVENEK